MPAISFYISVSVFFGLWRPWLAAQGVEVFFCLFNLNNVFPQLGTALFKGEMCCRNEFWYCNVRVVDIYQKMFQIHGQLENTGTIRAKTSTSSTGPVGQVKGVRRCSPDAFYSFLFSLKLSPDTSSITNWALQARNHSHHVLLKRGLMTQ